LRRAYLARRARGAPQLEPTGRLTDPLLRSLPFRLTGAQNRAWREIAADLGQPHPMQRLLQGDVGSGKTVVAALAMLHAVEAGHQAALMAPTEILAEQHYRKLAAWLEPLGINVAWLTGSLKKRDKDAAIAKVGAGETAIAIGTHALIEDKVEFARLGLAIVDEQHRFGVRQRLALKDKGSFAHQLAMSATPIPRTLAMSYYADLDVSTLDELPPGRTPVTTRLVAEGRRDEVLARVRDACRTGRQAYWVCPLIEESETLQLKTAEETYARLTAELPDLKVGLVHGRLKAAEKAAVMEGFVRNEIQVLVATTVIEVGVDVPNASLMVIEHAERFGLAQLHQLRGRVGRGAGPIGLHPALRAAAGRTGAGAAEGDLRNRRRLRNRARGPAPARPRRVHRRAPERPAAAALCRSRRYGAGGTGACRRRRHAAHRSGARRRPPAALARRARGTAQGVKFAHDFRRTQATPRPLRKADAAGQAASYGSATGRAINKNIVKTILYCNSLQSRCNLETTCCHSAL
jgi:superfamily II DNA/RNA helicase